MRALLREAARLAPVTDAQAAEAGRLERPGPPRRRLESLGIARAAIGHATGSVGGRAAAAGTDAGLLAVVAQLAVVPLLSACATRFRDQISATWLHGYCPICGAWPALAETRGLDRSRRLRCGRCSSDWAIPVLRCPYCDEMRHAQLHALVPEADEHTRRVDVCETCKGYVKTFATLQALPFRSLATMDLATVELDIMAQDRGYARPSHVAYPMTLTT
jgi:FdhE protein